MIIKKRPNSAISIATDDLKTNTGKEIVLKSMTNHYKTLLTIKPSIKIEQPKKILGKQHKTNVLKESKCCDIKILIYKISFFPKYILNSKFSKSSQFLITKSINYR